MSDQTIDMASETVVLHSTSPTAADDVGASLPQDGASYAFFAWKHAPSRRDIGGLQLLSSILN
jgi:hypothetical protein